MNTLLKKLLNSFNVCSAEDEIKSVIKEELDSMAAKYSEDASGNIIVEAGASEDKLMLVTHMDSTGFLSIFLEDDGNVRVVPVGEIKAESLLYQNVRFKNGVKGVVVPASNSSSVSFDNIYVETGLKDIKKKLTEGVLGKAVPQIREVQGLVYGSNGAAVCCYAFLELIRWAQSNAINKHITFVFSSKFNTQGSGARDAAFEGKGGSAIGLMCEEMDLDKGIGLLLMSKGHIIHDSIKKMVLDAADNSNLKLQLHVVDSEGILDNFHKEGSGFKSGVLCIPVKHKNTPAEVFPLKAIEDTMVLLKKLI